MAIELSSLVPDPIAREVRRRQPVPLYHRVHRPVEEEDAFREELVEAVGSRHAMAFRGRWEAFSPLPIRTANGSPALLAPTLTVTSVKPPRRSSVSSPAAENPR